MKKFLFTLIIIILSFNLVNANEYIEVTDNVEIRYKWYKEIIEGDYYLIEEKLKGYLIDYKNIKYGDYSVWANDYCSLSNENYSKETKIIRNYKKVYDVRYIKLEDFTYKDNIKIYQDNKILDYEIISNDNNIVKIDLKRNYRSDKIILYIENANNYKISFYRDEEFTKYIISKEIKNEVLLIPDKTWVTKDTKYDQIFVEGIYDNNDLFWKINEYSVCRYRKIYVYKYQIKREYYDDNYHVNVDGYIKDTSDYKVFYNGQPITNTIEITKEKIVKEPKIEYIYIPSENEIQKTDSSKETLETKENDVTTVENCLPKIEKEIIEKEIFKIPKKVYIIIFLLLLTIIFLIIKLYKKYVD